MELGTRGLQLSCCPFVSVPLLQRMATRGKRQRLIRRCGPHREVALEAPDETGAVLAPPRITIRSRADLREQQKEMSGTIV